MKKITLFLVLSILFDICVAQVGIGTVNPTAALDVQSSTGGLLAPRVALTNTLISAPVLNPQGGLLPAGTMVYNINTIADVSPGYYYWNGTLWVRMAAASTSNDWTLTGNAGTTAGTNFLGTTDATDLRIKTQNVNRWNISNANNGQLQSYSRGTAGAPIYSFQTDTNTGLFSSGVDAVGLTTNGIEKLRVNNNGNVVIGSTMSAGGAKLHITGAGSNVRIDALNNVNNPNNETGLSGNTVLTPVFVNGNGELTLQTQRSLNTLIINDNTTFLNSEVTVTSTSGLQSGQIYSTTFVLYQDAIIDLSYTIAAYVDQASGATFSDGRPRLFGCVVNINGNVISRSAQSLTNSAATGSYQKGYYYLNGGGKIALEGTPAGTTHTITILGSASGGSGTVRATFGGGGTANNILHVQASY